MFFTLCMIIGVLSCEVYAHVCHIYQEPIGRGNGERPRWWVSETNPCECTEMRLGGINMVSYDRPLEEVNFLLNGLLISTDPEEIRDFWGCEEIWATQSRGDTQGQQSRSRSWSWSGSWSRYRRSTSSQSRHH